MGIPSIGNISGMLGGHFVRHGHSRLCHRAWRGRTPPRCSARAGAFTLVEMLLVVALIALLISILLPSLTNARETARRVKCLANQRMIASGAAAYAGANRGHLPIYKTWTTHSISSSPDGYVDARPLLLELTGSIDGYYCPSHKVLDAATPGVGWNGTSQDRYMSYGPIGIWYQSMLSASFPKTYTAKPVFTKPTVDHQGNRPTRLAAASPDLAISTDSQLSWYAGSWGLSFTYPGDGIWPEHSGYYSYYAYPHRDAWNAWTGSNVVFYDGSGQWGNVGDIVRKNAPYPHGAKWIMHYQRGIYEGLVFW